LKVLSILLEKINKKTSVDPKINQSLKENRHQAGTQYMNYSDETYHQKHMQSLLNNGLFQTEESDYMDYLNTRKTIYNTYESAWSRTYKP
jgi:hypothetical protein